MYIFFKIPNLQRQWWVAYICICNLNTSGLSESSSKTSLCRGCMFQRKHRFSSEHFEELQWISTDALTKDIQWAMDLCIKNLLKHFFLGKLFLSSDVFFHALATVSSDTAHWIIELEFQLSGSNLGFSTCLLGYPEVLHTLSKSTLIYRRGIMIVCLWGWDNLYITNLK